MEQRYGTLVLEITQSLKDLLYHRSRLRGEGLSEYVARVLTKHEDHGTGKTPQEREALAYEEGELTGRREESARQWSALTSGWATYRAPKTPCVYALFQGRTVVYIGKTMRLHWRIDFHRTEKRIQFDNVRFMECATEDDALRVELEGIKALRPIFNVAGNPDREGNP